MSDSRVAPDRILVDTNVASYLFGEREQAKFFRPYFVNKTLAVSFMSVAEMYHGAYKNGWGPARLQKLEHHLKNYVVLPYDYDLCLKWAEIKCDLQRKGLSIEDADYWIAACALRYDCPLATNNARHFQRVKGLTLIAPGLI